MKKFMGDRLKFARLYRGITVEELSNEIGVSKQAISQYENNKILPTVENILVMSDKLKFLYEYFFAVGFARNKIRDNVFSFVNAHK